VRRDPEALLHSKETGDYGNRRADEGYVFICAACGKKSRDMYGNEPISYGWDESCALNCVIAKEPK
jgi:hypothetical protein